MICPLPNLKILICEIKLLLWQCNHIPLTVMTSFLITESLGRRNDLRQEYVSNIEIPASGEDSVNCLNIEKLAHRS